MARKGEAAPHAGKQLPKKLEQERLFALKYLELKFNGKQAAIAIGVPPAGAAVIANRLLNSVNVQDILQKELGAIQQRIRFGIDDVIEELRRIGFSNMQDFVSVNDGDPYIDLSAATKDQMSVVQELTSDTYMDGRGDDAREVKRTKLKLHPKLPALTTLMQYLQDPKKPVQQPGGSGPTIYNITQVNMSDSQAEVEFFKAMKDVTALVDGA